MQYRLLGNTGMNVSTLSFGASSLGSMFRKVKEEDGIDTVRMALDAGINFIDVSPYYGLTVAETVLGKALKGIRRDTYFLATKVGRYGADATAFDYSAERVAASVEESLKRLNVDYVDIIQCHDIEFVDLDQVVNETLPALGEVQAAGKARFVGITGLPLNAFKYVIERTEVDTVLSYSHYCLNDTALADMVPYFQEKGVGLINASPFNMGLLTNRGAPDWHPATAEMRELAAKAAAFCGAEGVDMAQLALQFSMANPDIPTTMVGTANPANIIKNIRWAEEPLDESLLAEVLAILEPIHNVSWLSGRPENN